MLPDSMNVGVIAENIRSLQGSVSNLEASAGKIPKDYSTTETNTGLKWIDGSEIYQRVVNGSFDAHDASFSFNYVEIPNIIPIASYGYIQDKNDSLYSDVEHFVVAYNGTNVYSTGIPAAYSEGKYYFVLEYIKKSAQSTKKKTSKKGE